MKVLICGSRELSSKEKDIMQSKLLEVLFNNYKSREEKKELTIINGYAKGADMVAYRLANSFGINIEIYKPDYKRFGNKLAPIIRDELMVNLSDKIYCFWNGYSNGTRYVRDYAKKKGKQVIVYNINEDQKGLLDIQMDNKHK